MIEIECKIQYDSSHSNHYLVELGYPVHSFSGSNNHDPLFERRQTSGRNKS
jgi:hypothetical protein